MEKNKRLFLSMSEEDVAKLDRLKDELGMNRSQYIRYLISGQKKILPGVLRDKKLIDTLSEINLKLQVIALKDGMSATDALTVYSAIDDIKVLLEKRTTFSPVDQKLRGESK